MRYTKAEKPNAPLRLKVVRLDPALSRWGIPRHCRYTGLPCVRWTPGKVYEVIDTAQGKLVATDVGIACTVHSEATAFPHASQPLAVEASHTETRLWTTLLWYRRWPKLAMTYLRRIFRWL